MNTWTDGSADVAILASTSIRELSTALIQGLDALGCKAEAMVWLDTAGLQFEPPEAATPILEEIAITAFSSVAQSADVHSTAYVLDTESAEVKAAVLMQPRCVGVLQAEHLHLLKLAGHRFSELLSFKRLWLSVRSLEQSEHLLKALFAIAAMAGSGLPLQKLLQGLHRIMTALMQAANFYIALYDAQREIVRFIYYVDEVNGPYFSVDQELSAAQMDNTIVLRLSRYARPIRGLFTEVTTSLGLSPDHIQGVLPVYFLGVPMRREGQAFGSLVVQSYKQGRAYSQSDQDILAFVAEHVLSAVERKLGQEALERHVIERTQQLAAANAQLQEKLHEKAHGMHLQATLYRIAALSHGQADSAEFYLSIHQAVSELLYAENFYIGLLSDDGTQLHIPYCADSQGEVLQSRPLSRGMSEYTLRHRQTVLMTADAIDELIAIGEIDPMTYGNPASCWLGAPLLGSKGVMGVVVLQSYLPDVVFTDEDADLLTFVSYQIASTLQRRRHDDALRKMNAQLELRVRERTEELHQQIAVREQIQKQLKHQVMHDPLTGLPNRLYLRDRLEQALNQQWRNPQQRFALLYLDVDFFKLFNDNFGHLVGDTVLQEVSYRLNKCVRKTDVVGRLSGDEFVILLADCLEPALASQVAQDILARMSEDVLAGGHQLRVSVSIGIAMSHPHYRTVDEMLHDADIALYQAKSVGRQRFVLFSNSMKS